MRVIWKEPVIVAGGACPHCGALSHWEPLAIQVQEEKDALGKSTTFVVCPETEKRIEIIPLERKKVKFSTRHADLLFVERAGGAEFLISLTPREED